MRKLLLLAVSLLLTVTTIYAERVSQEDAALVANNFMRYGATQSGVRKATGAKMVLKKAASAEENQYYVYENANGEGWVMVAADDAVTPILAYSKTGTFKTENQPANVKTWLGKYDTFIKKVEEDGLVANEETSAMWNRLRKSPPSTPGGNVVVDMLVQTQWDQDDPYWKLTPGSGSDKAYTGCVATAMAQVMKYWEWPKKGTGSHTYQPVMDIFDNDGNYLRTDTIYPGFLTVKFGETTYDWANMKNSYSESYTDAEAQAVATLMYHCGVSAEMQYGGDAYDGSGTYTINYGDWDDPTCAQNSFPKYFGYKRDGLTSYYRDGYTYQGTKYYDSWTDAAWTAMIKGELDKHHPIMYDGSGAKGGHSFICDGYDDQNYFHFNWGWSGSNDGWYKLDNLVPGSGGAGGGSYNFTNTQGVIIGIVPDKTFADVTITWSVQGTITTTTFKEQDPLVLPTNPADCSDKVFVGWTESSSVTGDKPADLFTSATGKVVTTAKTYYAVFATKTEGGGTTIEKATSIAVGDKVILVYETDSKELSGISSTSTKYGLGQDYTGTPTGVFPLDVVQGKTTGTFALMNGSNYLSWTSGNSLATITSLTDNSSWKISFSSGDAVIKNSSDETRSICWNSSSPRFACYTSGQKAVQLCKMGSGASYKDYSLNCGTVEPCVLAAISLNTDNVKKTFTVGETFNSTGLVVTAAYSNCSDKTVTPTSVTTPDLTAAGNKTVTVSYTENNVTKTATYQISVTEPVKYNVTWSVNGVPGTPVQYTEGEALILPTTPSDCSETQVFVGWTANNSISDGAKPVDLFTEVGSKKVNADITYYAVFATKTAGSGSAVSDTLTNALIGVSGTNYTAWTGKTANSSAVYAGQSAGGNDAIQLRSSNNNSGIVTTTSGGKATKIEVAWNSNTSAGRTTNIYGSNSAYESAADLYNSSKQGTLLGTCVVGTSTELTIDDEYEYIGIRSASGALYLDKVIITWGSGSATTYSNYTLSCQEVVVCELTGITLNTESVQTTFTVGDAFNSTGLVVTTAYSNCDSKNVTATVIAPDMTTAGTKQVTVTYTENEVTKTASYNITVNELPVVNTYTVTWHACDGNKVVTYKEGDPLVLPATPAANAGKAFYGWITDEHYTGATAPTIISAGTPVNDNADYYAVYE